MAIAREYIGDLSQYSSRTEMQEQMKACGTDTGMSGLGPHYEDTPSREDALLLFRFVEDTLLWCFRKGINF